MKKVNGFHLDEAKKQVKNMPGVEYTHIELQAIDKAVKEVRDLTTEELLNNIKNIKQFENNPSAQTTQLVALMAELLYRTKALPQEGSRDLSRSFEINTTQYLAIHSMLKSGGHVTSQIETGEGKSRIMMIAIACQYALGNTVDFVTSDLSLATRDYLEYQSFFKALGAETNMIYAQTPANQYRLKGINFSDASNLSLFRNRARSEGNGDLVIAKDPTKRALMLDEADKTWFDTADTRFNYSAQADESIRDIPWVYEYMVAFMSDKTNEDLYYSDADACNQAFYNYARGRVSGKVMSSAWQILSRVSPVTGLPVSICCQCLSPIPLVSMSSDDQPRSSRNWRRRAPNLLKNRDESGRSCNVESSGTYLVYGRPSRSTTSRL